MNVIWKIFPRKYDNVIDQVLANRKIGLDEESKRAFFKPDFTLDLHDPFLLDGISDATIRIRQAKENGETVGIFADYDADGIPGAALVYRTLKKIGIPAIVYIPDREGGYGLSNKGIDFLISKKCSLIITVDLGIKNFDEAKYCKDKNIDLIITDHHLPADTIPEGFLVINPKIAGSKYPFIDLCGCGVAYKLVSGLKKYFPNEINESFLKWNLDLVAISTIADVVGLVGENRTMAKYGLIVLNKTKNLGLRELIKVSNTGDKELTAYTAGFQIAPRINAPGRVDTATKSFELLVTDDLSEAKQLAIWLNEKNESRQIAMNGVIEDATQKVIGGKLDKNNIIIVTGEWIKGIIGPSASRISELFCRPVILFAKDKDKYVGSARSLEGINIVDILSSASSKIDKFGGHKGAAGVTVSAGNFDEFKSIILLYAKDHISKNDLVKKIKIDSEVNPEELTFKLFDQLSDLEPFGMGNPKPVLMLSAVQLVDLKYMGKENKHLSVNVKKDSIIFRSVYFSFDPNMSKPDKDLEYDIAFNLTVNEWNNNKTLNLNIISIRKHGTKE